MARYPLATWRGPVPNETEHAMIGHYGVVLHIQQGSEAGTDSWVHNPTSRVSAHFGNPKSGPLVQWVDTDDRAWAEVSGNPYWISVENEGYSGQQLTASQVENLAQLMVWAHTVYGVPLQVSDSSVPGLTGHGLGGAAWGGHYDCPGQPILDQRPVILARAAQIIAQNQEPDMDMNTPVEFPPSIQPYFDNVVFAGLGDQLARFFPLGGTAGFGVTTAYTAASARAAALQSGANGRQLTAITQQFTAFAAVLGAVTRQLSALQDTVNQLAAAYATKPPAAPAAAAPALSGPSAPPAAAPASLAPLGASVPPPHAPA